MESICALNCRVCNEDCERCGWELNEAKMRKKQLSQNGLTTDKNGIKKLIIKRQVGEEQ